MAKKFEKTIDITLTLKVSGEFYGDLESLTDDEQVKFLKKEMPKFGYDVLCRDYEDCPISEEEDDCYVFDIEEE